MRTRRDHGGRSDARDAGVLMAGDTFYLQRRWRSDGKVRTGSLTAETDKLQSRSELRNAGAHSGLRRARAEEGRFELKLPAFQRRRRRDVLFFTQELSTLLNAGVPLDRALSITGELTERAAVPLRRAATSCACSRAADRWPTAWPRTRVFLRPVRQHGARGRGVAARSPRCSNAWPNSSARATICAATSSRR